MLKKVSVSALVLTGLALLALVGLLLTGDLGSTAAAAPAAQAAPGATALPRTITVVGQGRVTSQPDIATATVGVEVVAETVQAASAEASSRMEKIMAALKAQGIADKDIQTSNYSISYERNQTGVPLTTGTGTGSAEPAGVYRVSNMLNLKIRDMTKVGTVIDAVVEAGANTIWGVNFALDNTTKLEADARAKAVENAKARAQELAGLSGVKVGQVVEISEVIGGGAIGVRYSVASAPMGMGGGGGASVSPGELEYTSEIQVTFAIE